MFISLQATLCHHQPLILAISLTQVNRLALSLRLRPNVGVHLDDADMLVEAVKFIRKLTLTLPLEQFHQEFVEPGPKIQTDKEIKEWVVESGMSIIKWYDF